MAAVSRKSPFAVARNAVCIVAILALSAGVVSGDGDGGCGSRVCDEAAIAKLAVLYAYGIDSLAPGNFDGGVAILQQVFTPDASIAVCFAPGQCVNKTGPLEWAQFSSGAFAAGGYSATQHFVGNQNIVLDNNKQAGTMVSYLTASQFIRNSTNFDLFHGAYYDKVVKVNGGEWRISSRDLHTTSFVRVPGQPVS